MLYKYLRRIMPLVAVLVIPILAVSQTINVNPNLPLANSSVAIADLDGDGLNEVIFVSTSPSVTGTLPGLTGDVICHEIGGESGPALVAKKLGRRQDLFPPDPPVGDGGLWVHALDGYTNYATELSPNHDGLNTLWPRQIAIRCVPDGKHPTVAIHNNLLWNMNPDGGTDLPAGLPTVVVGGGNPKVYAFKTYGEDLHPGFPTDTHFDFFNACALTYTQVRGETPFPSIPLEYGLLFGTSRYLCADQSTFYYSFTGDGIKRQDQFSGDFIYSSVAHADTFSLDGGQLADGIPDALTAADGLVDPPPTVHVWNELGKSILSDTQDLLAQLGYAVYSSSPIAARIGPGITQDIMILRPGAFQLFLSNNGSPLLLEWPISGGNPLIGRDAYGTPLVANLSSDPAGPYDTMVFADDGGNVYALKLITDPPTCAPATAPCLRSAWQQQPPPLDNGRAISASPIVVKLRDDWDNGRPQIVVANDGNKIFILKASDGSVLATYALGPADNDGAIWSTIAVGTRRVDLTRNPCQDDGALPTNCPVFWTGTRHGLIEIVLVGFPPLNLDATNPAAQHALQWATFHRSNTRTGALAPSQDGSKLTDPAGTHNRGSIGGKVHASCQQAHARLYEADGATPVIDYYNAPAPADSAFNANRYLFEATSARTPANAYLVRLNNNPANDVSAPVDPGLMTRANHTDPCAPPP
jgi:hypothetical protein